MLKMVRSLMCLKSPITHSTLSSKHKLQPNSFTINIHLFALTTLPNIHLILCLKKKLNP